MERKVSILLVIGCLLVFCAALPVFTERVKRERESNRVEMVIDWDDIEWLGKTQGVDPFSLLQDLRAAGFETVGVNEYSLRRLKDAGKVVPVAYPQGKEPYRYFQIVDPDLRQTLVQRLTLMGKKAEEKEAGIIGTNVFFEEEDKMGLGWNEKLVRTLEEAGFRVILRPINWYALPPAVLTEMLKEPVWEQAEGVIFQGDAVLGHGNGDSLRLFASFLREKGLFWGYLEFVGQKSEYLLAQMVPEYTVRVHSIPPDELKNYTPETARERFVRAVKERSVPLLYLRIFTDSPSATDLARNLAYLRLVKEALLGEGFELGKVAVPHPSFGVPRGVLLLFAVGLAIFTLLLVERFFGWRRWVFFLVLVVLVGVIFRDTLWGMCFISFGAGVVIPTLAVIVLIDRWQEKKMWSGVGLAFCLLFAGGILVSHALYHWLFVLRIYQYWGVKPSLLIPPILVILYLFRSRSLGVSIGCFLLEDLRRFELLFASLLGVSALLYLTRSGNFPLLPASSLEAQMRILLERLLFMRPRTKEFLIGYPALWLLMSFSSPSLRPSYRVILWLGVTVGFVTFFNSFCHVHTPLLYIFLRFVNALFLSVGVFVVYWVVVKLALWIWGWLSAWGD